MQGSTGNAHVAGALRHLLTVIGIVTIAGLYPAVLTMPGGTRGAYTLQERNAEIYRLEQETKAQVAGMMQDKDFLPQVRMIAKALDNTPGWTEKGRNDEADRLVAELTQARMDEIKGKRSLTPQQAKQAEESLRQLTRDYVNTIKEHSPQFWSLSPTFVPIAWYLRPVGVAYQKITRYRDSLMIATKPGPVSP